MSNNENLMIDYGIKNVWFFVSNMKKFVSVVIMCLKVLNRVFLRAQVCQTYFFTLV